MITGNIFITFDKNIIINQALNPTANILFLEDECDVDPELYRMCNSGNRATYISCLLPDPQSFLIRVDGTQEDFEKSYFSYLSSPVCRELIAVIFKSLYLGRNLYIYASPENADTYVREFLKFFGLNYGLIIGIIHTSMPDRGCAFDARFIPFVLENMYLYDILTIEEMFMNCPTGYKFSPPVVMKLVEDVKPYLKNPYPTIDDYSEYFYNYKERVIKSKKFLKPFVHRG